MTSKKEKAPEKEKEVDKDDTVKDEVHKDETGSNEDTEKVEKTESADSAESQEDKETFESKYLRMTADFQNYKRRVEKEKNDIYINANEKFAQDLLEVVDNFERAIEQDKSNKADEKFLKGMEMILKQLLDVLKKNNIEEIEALGTEFDPNFHHAVAMESSDEYDKGCVMDVMQKGYKLKDRVIRPAMVRVAE